MPQVQNVMEHAASHGDPPHRGGPWQPLNQDQIEKVCERIQTKVQEQCCLKVQELRENMAASIGGDATSVDRLISEDRLISGNHGYCCCCCQHCKPSAQVTRLLHATVAA